LAAKHQVYLGTDPNPTNLIQTTTAHTLDLGPLGLKYGKTYTWRVDEVNDAASPAVWQGDAWSFTTIGYAVVDDFESYDDLCNRIFFGWVDGFGYSAAPECGVVSSSGNGTNSTVGNVTPPFAEQVVIHSGTQSLPMAFDNTRSPYYSEAQKEWTTAQSWKTGGANALVVYLRGDAPDFLETTPGTILMNGTGADIWNSTDQFRFAYKQLKGNGSITARVDNVANTDGWAKAGVMIRETFDAGGTNALVAMTPANGISFQWRPTRDAASSNVAVAGLAAPYWVKVTRTGDTFTAQYSTNGVAWTDLVATPSVVIPMASDVYIGLAVCSHVTGSVCGAKFSNVSTTGSVSGSWQTTGVGAAQTGGNTPETFYVRLQDSAGTAKVVANPDPTVIATGAWQEWSIPFSQFSGINMGSIKKMAVGVGNPASPKAGGSGKLYIDDIRLTRTAQ
jgi:regulation of enolase protein 1 (concanavalin A-like superfamily)